VANVTVFNKKGPDYRIVPVSGVMGGMTPQGMVACDLFVERPELPESIVLDVGSDGRAMPVSHHPQTQAMIRESMVGLMIEPHVAKAVGEWLVKQAEAYENRVLGRRGGGVDGGTPA